MLILVLAAAGLVAAPAFAQSGQTPSPAMQAARQAVMTQCAADMKSYCDGKTGREMMMCMRDNADKAQRRLQVGDGRPWMSARQAAAAAAPQ